MDIRGPYTEHAENAMHGNLMSLLNWRAIDILDHKSNHLSLNIFFFSPFDTTRNFI